MRCMITGGSGFGGTGLVNALLSRDFEITIVDITAPSHADSLQNCIEHGHLKYLWKSVHDLSPRDVEGHDIIVHFAAQADVPMGFPSPLWTMWENVMGTTNVLECAKAVGVDRFLLASSGNVFGRPLYLPINESHPLTPHNPYAASKACQEMLAMAYWRSYKVPVIIMRNGVVIGEGMRREIFIYKWLSNIIRNKPIVIEGGNQTRDPCYVSDTVLGWLLTLEAPKEKVVGEIFHISRGKEYTLNEIARECMGVAGNTVAIDYQPYRPGEEGMRECFDVSKAKEILGYTPRVDLCEALEKTLTWIKKRQSELV
jgi:UDP-glucose 4-epimerase